MYHDYDKAFRKGITFFKSRGYSKQYLAAFKYSCRCLREYLATNGLPFTHDNVLKWIAINEVRKPYWRRFNFSVALLLEKTIREGQFPEENRKGLQIRSYSLLLSWQKNLVDHYIESISGIKAKATVENQRRSIVFFLNALQKNGVQKRGGITHSAIVRYFRNDESAPKSRGQRNCDIRSFLLWLEREGGVKPTASFAMDQHYNKSIIVLQEEPRETREIFRQYRHCADLETAFEANLRETQRYIKRERYSKSCRSSLLAGLNRLSLFLYTNELSYTPALSFQWLALVKGRLEKASYCTTRQSLGLLSNYVNTGTLTTTPFYLNHATKYRLDSWSDELLDGYLAERKKEGWAKSTLSMDRHSCERFLTFMQNQGVNSPEGFNPILIKEFYAQDEHSTAEGRNAYGSRIRGFLRHLGRIGLIPPAFEMALPTRVAPKERIVTVLDQAQLAAIETHRITDASPLGLRTSAMLSLGIRMGLRAIDIVRLRLSDIAWDEQCLSLVQQKTGRCLRLPFPTEVGNGLYRYITEGRPQTDSPFVFVKHVHPFGALTSGVCRAQMYKLLKKAGCNPAKGFHQARRTFATTLLRAGNTPSIIAQTLGHATNDTVGAYLSIDEEMMRRCPLSLTEIPFQGGLL